MWTVTELVFWNEQAMYIRGLKVSSAQPSASSAVASSSSAAFASGSKPMLSSAVSGAVMTAGPEASCRIPLRPLPLASAAFPFWRPVSAFCVAVGSIPGSLDGALALAALHPVRLRAVPVDEVQEIFRAELDRQLQVRDQLLEGLHADALGEVVEPLAVIPLLLVVANPALHRVGHALGRQARLQARAVDDLSALEVAAYMCDVGRDGVIADLDRGAVEANRADVVLRAAVRAAAHLDVDSPGEGIGDVHLLDPLLDLSVEAHRAGDPELAAVGAGAADHVVDPHGARLAEAELLQPEPHVVDGLLADPAQNQVLLHGGAREAAAEVAHDRREAPELLRAQVAADHLCGGGDESLLALGLDVGVDPGVELRLIAVRGAV